MLQLEARRDEELVMVVLVPVCYFVVCVCVCVCLRGGEEEEEEEEDNTYQLQLMLRTSRAYDVTTLSTMMTSAQDTKRGRTDKTITRSIIRKHQWCNF